MNDIKTSYKTQEGDRELIGSWQGVDRVMDEKCDKKEKEAMRIMLKPMRNS